MTNDEVLAFFGASITEEGLLHIDMKQYHAAHLCQEHSFQPWRRNEIEEKCVMCIVRDATSAATRMREACLAKVKEIHEERLRDLRALTDKGELEHEEADYERAVLFVMGNVVTALSSLTLKGGAGETEMSTDVDPLRFIDAKVYTQADLDQARKEAREAAFREAIKIIEDLTCAPQFEGNWRNGYSHAQNDAFRAIEAAANTEEGAEGDGTPKRTSTSRVNQA